MKVWILALLKHFWRESCVYTLVIGNLWHELMSTLVAKWLQHLLGQ